MLTELSPLSREIAFSKRLGPTMPFFSCFPLNFFKGKSPADVIFLFAPPPHSLPAISILVVCISSSNQMRENDKFLTALAFAVT